MEDFPDDTSNPSDHIVIKIGSADDGVSPSVDEDDVERPRYGVVRHLSIDENSPLLGSRRIVKTQKPSQLQRFWKWYQGRLASHPLVTKSITSAILTGCGDLAAQSIDILSHTTSTTSWDVLRFLRFFCLGWLLQAPISHYFYKWLDETFPPTPSPWTHITLIKGIIDQGIFAPSWTALVFLFLDLSAGDSPQDIIRHFQSEFGTTMIANWKLWVPATMVNLAWVPPELRVLYCNVVFFVWSIILSILMNAPTVTSTDHV